MTNSLPSVREARRRGQAAVKISKMDGQAVVKAGRVLEVGAAQVAVLCGVPLATCELLIETQSFADQPASSTRQHLAAQLPGPPWQVRSVPADDVDFAMWFTTLSPGFAAVLDYGPVVLTARGSNLDTWDWRLTALPPDRVWPLIGKALDD